MPSLQHISIDSYRPRNAVILSSSVILVGLVLVHVAGVNFGNVIQDISWEVLVAGVLTAYSGLRLVRAVEQIASATERASEN